MKCTHVHSDLDELFGEPVFSVIPLSMIEENEKEEKEEVKVRDTYNYISIFDNPQIQFIRHHY